MGNVIAKPLLTKYNASSRELRQNGFVALEKRVTMKSLEFTLTKNR